MSERVVRWREVAPLPAMNGDTENLLATVDTVRGAWEEHLRLVSPAEFEEARRRTLRRHAIETGIIERLYDVSRGVTEALVAEGITRQAAAREGGISEDTLAVIHSQLEALELLVDAVQAGRPLTTYFVKELHAAIARNQPTYDARDPFGQLVKRPLLHGAWKEFPNDVVRADGSRLEYVPPGTCRARWSHYWQFSSKLGMRIRSFARPGCITASFASIHSRTVTVELLGRSLCSCFCVTIMRRWSSTGTSARITSMRWMRRMKATCGHS